MEDINHMLDVLMLNEDAKRDRATECVITLMNTVEDLSCPVNTNKKNHGPVKNTGKGKQGKY